MIEVWTEGTADRPMPEAIVAELADLVGRHPWWQARASLTRGLLDRLGIRPPARVLDAGCGWGVTFEALEQSGYRVSGLDVVRRALERLDLPGRTLIEADLTCDWPATAERFDAVLALDVIEHLDDDREAVKRLGRLVRPGGFLVLSVPALPELFTEFDAIQGHRRRYQPETLRDAFLGSGLEVESVFWWGGWLVPMLRRQRRWPKARGAEAPVATYRRYLALPPWPAPWALRLGFALERRRALDGRLRSGTSLFAVARRPG
jgi:SAM-dependent methyltransferase